MKIIFKAVMAVVLASGLAQVATGAGYTTVSVRDPIYLGAQACGKCHDGPGIGHQFSKWRLTAHARAYAALYLPESKEITRLSGLTEEPYKSRMCLGCHATAAEEEDWRKDSGFHLEDGLQCEACHGPGSEYATVAIMSDAAKAKPAGLRMPDKDTCRTCHRPKGSHDAVLKRKPFDLDQAWQAIAHKMPDGDKPDAAPLAAPAATAPVAGRPQYTGVMACTSCHGTAESNFQFSAWRLTPHARAYAVLATPHAAELAAAAGVTGDPQLAAQCLKCHTTGYGASAAEFQADFDLRDGVQCEACHGAGGAYSTEAVMRDRPAAHAKGLRPVEAATCQACHDNAHGKPFDYASAVKGIAHPGKAPANAKPDPAYKNPLNLTLSPDNKELWVACEQAGTVVVVDTAARAKALEFKVGGQPTEIAFAPDGRRAFVSNRLDDSVSVVDVATHFVTATIEVGDEPHGLLVDREGKYLYVLNTSIDNVSVIDLATLKEVKRLSASRSPWDLALSPDGRTILVTNVLSRYTGDRNPSLSEVTVIDAERAIVKDRVTVPGANLLEGIAWHPSGKYAVFTQLRSKNLVPMTRINHGWTITNGLGLLWADGTVDQVLLDQNDLCFPDPTDIVITPDGKLALVTSSSSDRVAVVDLQKLTALLQSATPQEREHVIPNHTGKPAEYVVASIPVNTTPRGLACSADGATVYVASKLDDSVTVIDVRKLAAVGRIDLGGPKEVTLHRRGERLFHSANIAFRRQFSCSTCHPDGHIDNLAYSIEDSGVGMNPVDNRTLRGIADTAPLKWSGVNPSLKRQCGARLAVFITRIQPFTPDQLGDLHDYLCSIPRPPNRYRQLGQDLTEAQRRGQAIFERTRKNDGTPIAPGNRCFDCHPAPLYTDGRLHDVGTKFPLDRDGKFDPPHLMNIYDSAPYLHNGIARTLEEIWTTYNPNDQHGVTNDMTKDQLNDLVEYLKTL